jgi:arylformamidase
MQDEVRMKQREKKIFDISPEISANTAVFPGDTVFSQTVLMDCKLGDHLGLSSFTTTPHIGAHTDAPNHYHAEGVGIAERSLDYYYGPCQVIEVLHAKNRRITLEDFKEIPLKAPRVLFKTLSFPDPNHWTGDFAALSSEVIDFLAKNGVKLVGIDTPSIDLSDDKILQCHTAVYKNNMAILEGIVLDAVPAGEYQLVALPLKMKNLDASPVRAILVDL